MKIKKLNAIFTWIVTALVIAHVAGTCVMVVRRMAGLARVEAIARAVEIIPRATMTVAIMHAILSIAMIFTVQENKMITYTAANKRTIIQRATADISLIMLILHVVFVSGADGQIGTVRLIFSILIDVIFYVAMFTHLSVSFSKSLITLGVISTDAAEAKANKIASVVCKLLGVISVIASVIVLLASAGIL